MRIAVDTLEFIVKGDGRVIRQQLGNGTTAREVQSKSLRAYDKMYHQATLTIAALWSTNVATR